MYSRTGREGRPVRIQRRAVQDAGHQGHEEFSPVEQRTGMNMRHTRGKRHDKTCETSSDQAVYG